MMYKLNLIFYSVSLKLANEAKNVSGKCFLSSLIEKGFLVFFANCHRLAFEMKARLMHFFPFFTFHFWKLHLYLASIEINCYFCGQLDKHTSHSQFTKSVIHQYQAIIFSSWRLES